MEQAAVTIKEEPLDFDYDQVECEGRAQEEETTLDLAAHLKIECDDTQLTEQDEIASVPAAANPFKIVEVQKDIITVNAADFKSDDERVFIASLRLKKFAKPHQQSPTPTPIPKPIYAIRCSQCPTASFSSRYLLETHEMLCHRTIKCLICSYACTTVIELSEHMQNHDNILDTKYEKIEREKPKNAAKKRKLLNELVLESDANQLAENAAKRKLGISERLLLIEDNLITRPTNSPTHLPNDIKIKQELPDDSQQLDSERILPDDINYPQTNPSAINAIVPQIDIKKELEDVADNDTKIETKHVWKTNETNSSASSATANDNYLESLRHSLSPSLKIKTEPDATPIIDTTTPARPIYKNIQLLSKLGHPISLQGLKMVKLAPNTKIVRIPPPSSKAKLPMTMPPLNVLTKTPLIGLHQMKTVVVKAKSLTASADSHALVSAQSPPQLLSPSGYFGAGASNPPKLKETELLLSSRGIIVTKLPEVTAATHAITAAAAASPLSPPLVTVSLNSLRKDTTIDAQDLQKLLTQVRNKAVKNEQKVLTIPNDVLHAIERLPAKRQLINGMLQTIRALEQQGKNVQKADKCKNEVVVGGKSHHQQQQQQESTYMDNCGSESSTSASFNTSDTSTNDADMPPMLYLPVGCKNDSEFFRARRLNPGYLYIWMCPRCPCHYRQKFSFINHLKTSHHIDEDELQELYAEVRPFKEVKSSESIAAKAAQEQVSIKIKTEHLDTAPIKMSALKSFRDADAVNKKLKNSYTCTKCNRTCSSRTMLNDHVRANCSREPLYPCPECSKRFYSISTLTCHLSIHTGELPYKCSYCEKRFRTRGQVTVHHRTHTGERPFTCQVCSQSFTHRETLISHLSRHIGMKRYKCYACDKTFSCISGLKTHRSLRSETCAKVRLSTRAIGPRVRVVRGQVIFEQQPEINPYLRSEDPQDVLGDIQNQMAGEKDVKV